MSIKMEKSNEFNCQSKGRAILPGVYKMNAYRNGTSRFVVLNGDEIQHQFKIGENTLLITHYDYFDGVNYWFTLLSNDLRILDIISTPDYFGFLENIEIIDGYKLQFGFHGTKDKWELSYSPEGKWNFKLSDLIRRHPRKLFSKRYLFLKCL